MSNRIMVFRLWNYIIEPAPTPEKYSHEGTPEWEEWQFYGDYTKVEMNGFSWIQTDTTVYDGWEPTQTVVTLKLPEFSLENMAEVMELLDGRLYKNYYVWDWHYEEKE